MRQWLLVVLALAAFALVFNTHLLSYGSLWCDQRVNQISAEKDKSVRQAIDQMHEALAQQDASVEALQAERAVSRALRKKLAKLAKGDERLQRLLKLADERQDEQLSSHTSRRRASPPLEEAAAAPPSPPAASAAVASSSPPPPPPPLPPLPPPPQLRWSPRAWCRPPSPWWSSHTTVLSTSTAR